MYMNAVPNHPVDIYARVSRKGDKEQRSTTGQVQACRAVLAERGMPEGEVHVDDGRSAWNPQVKRPGWDAIMDRLEAGESGGVIVFDMERFSRQPAEGERLIAAAQRGLVVLDSDGEFDLTTSSGKKHFRDAMTAAAYYSDRLHDRVTRGKRLKAMAGEPNGRVSAERGPFGFLPDGTTPHPEESAILQELVRRTLAGETQESLMADLAERGITTATGRPWTRAGLRQVLTRPLNAGLVEYKGQIVGTLRGDPVIGPDDHSAVLAVIAARRPGRPPSDAYLCSGAVTCGRCGRPLSGRPRINMKHYSDGEVRREYWCNPTSGRGGCGKIAVDQRALDAYAAELAIMVLSNAEMANAAEAAAVAVQAEAASLDAEIGRAEDLRVKLADRLGRGEIELEVFDAATKPLDKRVAAMREQRKALGAAGPKAVPRGSEAAWRARWEAADPAGRREMLRLALRGRRLVVGPADRKNRSDIAARVRLSE
jgi:DNA invertase Pin-like site-specific DNA recombinase